MFFTNMWNFFQKALTFSISNSVPEFNINNLQMDLDYTVTSISRTEEGYFFTLRCDTVGYYNIVQMFKSKKEPEIIAITNSSKSRTHYVLKPGLRFGVRSTTENQGRGRAFIFIEEK